MDRRKFLTLIPTAVTTAIVAPKLLVPEESKSVWGPVVEQKIKNRISTIRMNPLQVYEPRRIVIKVGRQYLEDFDNAMKEYAKYYSHSLLYEER